jgi:hypothetical protein
MAVNPSLTGLAPFTPANLDVAAPKRISKTCVTCRARKVRCDGRRDICTNCERLGFACSYTDGHGAAVRGGLAAGLIPRKRARQACTACHARKAKCSGTLPRCDRCRLQGLDCEYKASKRPSMGAAGMTSPRSASHDDPASEDTASPAAFHSDEQLEAVAQRTFDAFFAVVHHIPGFTFLHRASLMQRYHAGLVDRPLLLALVGITSLLSDLGPGLREYGDRCVAEAEERVLAEIDRPSTLRLQALMLVIKHRILSRRFSSGLMLFSVASRFASALRLNHEAPKLCFLAQESRRRLMWAMYVTDVGISGGIPDFSLWANRPEAIRVQLPCNERNFEYDLPETTEPLVPVAGPDGNPPPLPDDVGFLALHIRVCWLRSRVLMYTKPLPNNYTPADLEELPQRVAALEEDLRQFAARLPASFRWSEPNVRLRAYSPRLCVYLMTHVWWEMCHCELYRVVLAGLPDGLPANAIVRLDPGFVAACRRKAYEHARAMADMFGVLLTMDNGVPVTDLDLPVCVYWCARMLLYGLETSAEELAITKEGVVEMMRVCRMVLDGGVETPAGIGIVSNFPLICIHQLTLSSAGRFREAAQP